MFQKEYWERADLKKRRSPEHPVIKAYVLSKIKQLSHYVDLTPETTLLDVGCGNGFFTYYLDRICDVYGVDYSQRMIEMNPVKKTSVMDACNLQFRDNSFDIVFCHGLLHHVEDMDKVIREMKRVSRKYVIILEPNRNNPIMFLYSALVKEERKTLKFSLSYLRKNVRRNGLHIMASFSHGMMVTNKLPVLLLPVLRFLQFRQPFGMTNFIIATKENY